MGVMVDASNTERNEHEVLADRKIKLGPKLGELYHALSSEVLWLHFEWGQYRELFAVNEKQIDLLNESASSFFWLIQTTLWDSVVLSIARLTGSPKSSGQDNLSLKRLPMVIQDVHLRAEVEGLIEKAQPSWDAFTKWRHKHLAHRDLNLAIGKGAEPLPPQSRADIEQALSGIRDVLNAIEGKNSEVLYEMDSSSDAGALLYLIRKGQEADKAEMAEIMK